MEVFDYPLNKEYILRKKKLLKKQLLEKENFIEKKIAILGGVTTFEIKNILELFLLNDGIKPTFYESEYNKYFEDALFGKELELFNPDIVHICTSYKNISNIPLLTNTFEENQKLLEKECQKFNLIWETLKNKNNCIIIQNNFEYPRNREVGNLDKSYHGCLINFIDKLNIKISDYSNLNKNFYINDINYLSAKIGLEKWHDNQMWYGYKYAQSFETIPELAKNLSNIIKSIYGKTKKALVLDLDNTLWGGIIGDDGIHNIKIGTETAIGEAYTEFQKYIQKLKNRGIVLAISSKNEDAIAREGLNKKEMILKEKDFFCIKANWQPKYLNINNISKEINIGLDSVVFMDDNPAEREIVKQNLKNVSVPEIGDNIANYIDYLDNNGYFEVSGLSTEDFKREEYYKLNKERADIQSSYLNYEEFLKSLDMVADIAEIKLDQYDRVAQLTNKTNQFNLTTKRYSLSDIEKIANNESNLIVCGRLKDKFGDNGLISIIIGKIKHNEFHIDLWLMSCRVLKRDMEKAMFDYILEYCKKNNIKKIIGYYKKTNKNMMVENHYKELGFINVEKSGLDTKWELIVEKKQNMNKIIKIGEY